MVRRFGSALLALLLAGPLAALAQPQAQPPAAPQAAGHRVLTSLPPLHALTAALAEGTAIKAVRVPEGEPVPMEGQANALARLAPQVFTQAEAVVTLEGLWRADPLYAAARRQNLRIVEIDASRSWDATRSGPALIRAPANDVPWASARDAEDTAASPYAWLSPVNAMRMSALIAADLARLSPADAPRVQRNLGALEGRLRQLKAEYGERMATAADPRVLSLASEFVYLYDEFGIFVEGWFVKQDVDWTDDDRAALTRLLKERGIRVVVHKWQPDAQIVRAIEQGGARLVVLDAGDSGALADPSRPYESLIRSNMDALLSAFQATRDGTASRR